MLKAFESVCRSESCFFGVFLGGAGGKGTWGKLTEVYDEDGRTRDFKDPNYDSIEDYVRCMVSLFK